MGIKISGTLESPNNPRVLYNNLATSSGASITSSSDASTTFAKENILDPATYNFWQPSAQDSFVDVGFNTSTSLNYIAIRGHNCGTQGNTINIKALTSSPVLPTIASLEAWYDIADAGTITESGGSVSQVDDKSSNSNHATQSTGSLQPTFGSDASGNFLQFTGSGLSASQNYLELTSTANGKTVFFVCDHDGSQFSGVLGNDQASSSHIFLQQNSYAISLDGATSDVGSWYLDGTFQATGGNVGSPTAIGNGIKQHTVKFNSGDPATGFNLISAFTNTKVGGFGGKIREIIIYDEYLSDTDRESVENYLLNKWITGSGYQTIDTLTPTNNDIVVFLFDNLEADNFRVEFVGGSVPTVSNIFFGNQLVIPQRIYGGITPISFAKKTAIRPNVSDGGQFLGRSKISQGVQLRVNFEHITSDFARSDLLPFFEDAVLNPFFFAWRPEQYPDELCYVQTTSDLTATNMGLSNLMSFSINATGRDD